jgi:hypothetical protein
VYRDVLRPNKENDARFGKQWKRDVMHHVSGEPIFAYLLTGEDVENKAKAIKNHLRSVLCGPSEEEKIVKNVAHVADAKDFDVTVKTLFL